MRTRPALFLAVWLAGCAGDHEPDPLAARAETLRARACACTTVACATEVEAELVAVVGAADAPDGDERARLTAAIDEIGTCMVAVALGAPR